MRVIARSTARRILAEGWSARGEKRDAHEKKDEVARRRKG